MEKAKPRLAFIDHSFHQRSTATDFLVELLEGRYQVDRLWDHSWRNQKRLELPDNYNVIVIFQTFESYPIAELRRHPQVVLVPMYDQSGMRSDYFWSAYQGFKFLNFSRCLHRRMLALGLSSRYFQYYPASQPCPRISGIRGFLWQRQDRISWPLIRRLLGSRSLDAFHLHLALDPAGYQACLPSPEERQRYAITCSEWFEERSGYLEALDGCNLYFAPRANEGIGMSFLEALARGKAVVAPDLPTMNEYITHGQDGYLYDLENPTPLDFDQLSQVAARAHRRAARGHEAWMQARSQLLDYVAEPAPGCSLLARGLRRLRAGLATALSVSCPQKPT